MEHIDPTILKRTDTRSGRPCEFCMQLDPNFSQRRPMDQIVTANRSHTASAHLTEDGYVRHRWLELGRMVGANPRSAA
jgi:hypothetical protein